MTAASSTSRRAPALTVESASLIRKRGGVKLPINDPDILEVLNNWDLVSMHRDMPKTPAKFLEYVSRATDKERASYEIGGKFVKTKAQSTVVYLEPKVVAAIAVTKKNSGSAWKRLPGVTTSTEESAFVVGDAEEDEANPTYAKVPLFKKD